ncbi:NADH-quinone oxidoreductase subunit C [Dyella nitratireducens]|uniref:Formate hydrogenlyase/hydrogenase/NADH dehydrogenase subunit n=1 Tax=Dyella nitratireducens TaxID=1849580 RepID=A0ABQ1GV84_9GAMM|nr:NADH-quinone oxidoreductase subunit C [Dyella nitratireducens]GGA51017.1 formate hydrogenlyase/hydrogenase/NADH dehydrogenase subunit [Dyella nitratireducens]GLQ42671.1 formate hydrogenlyase/hydrogenase/NADH dehydrogenase subunit [Dyella nitratireducens]
MSLDVMTREGMPLPANVPARRLIVDAHQWTAVAQQLHEAGAYLLALWGTDERDRSGLFRVFAAFLASDHVVVLQHAMAGDRPVYPSLGRWYPVAIRLQRAIYDLLGLESDDGDTRPWLRHSGWPEDRFPLRKDVSAAATYPNRPRPYPFVPVNGEGVHEIPVGPIHAGTIEPGHFRFSVVGEKVLRLEERLGYTHKGVAKRFEALSLLDGHRLAARVSGDSAVAFSWAYCAAVEAITGTTVSPRTAYLRALALERERIANHLGDLGALGNDAGLAFGLMQFSALKERLLRLNQDVFNQRYLMDYVIPGGVQSDVGPRLIRLLLDEAADIERDVVALRAIYDEHTGLQDRFKDAGQLTPSIAKAQGALGLVARASGIERDLRVSMPWAPYDDLRPAWVLRVEGDVAARVQVRFDEVMESLRLSRLLLEKLPRGSVSTAILAVKAERIGLGVIEGWRGPVMVALEAEESFAIRRCHVHDPSWQNWPLIEHAIIGNIVPDFPLINKSFNLSYSGHDG